MKRFIFIIGLAILQCLPTQVKEMELCDLWDDKGICKEPWEGNEKTYYIPQKDWDKLKTNKDLFHYLYFTSRETPGIIFRWNKNLSSEEKKKQFSKSCRFHITNNNDTYSMDGYETGEDYLGGFHYLGSIWERDFHKRNLLDKPPVLSHFQSSHIYFTRNCGGHSYSELVIISLKIIP